MQVVSGLIQKLATLEAPGLQVERSDQCKNGQALEGKERAHQHARVSGSSARSGAKRLRLHQVSRTSHGNSNRKLHRKGLRNRAAAIRPRALMREDAPDEEFAPPGLYPNCCLKDLSEPHVPGEADLCEEVQEA